jgi:ABC-type nitrate/sulfonate/bicarbonate transport system permease component
MSSAAMALGRDREDRWRLPTWASGALGGLGVLAFWIFAAETWGIRKGIPAPWSVVSHLIDDWHYYPTHIRATMWRATQGYLWGNMLAIILALVFVMVPFLEKALMQIAVATYCLPIIAIGPILQVVFKGDTPKVALAALSVFFTTLIGMLVGLRSADKTSLELVRAYGGGSFMQLRKVRLIAALPQLFGGLRIAAPAAVLGAIIGEYLGGEKGLGIFMINSQQAFDVPRTWGVAIISTSIAGAVFALTSLVARLVTPWAPKSASAR